MSRSARSEAEDPARTDGAAGGDAPAGADPLVDRIAPGTYRVVGLLVAAAFVVILNETVMSVALPTLMAEFWVTAATAQWLTTGFMLTMAVVIPFTGWLLTRLRLRQVFVLAMGTFLAGTLLAAVAPVCALLLAGRVVQAVGTAIVMPLLMATAMGALSRPQHPHGSALLSTLQQVAAATGTAVFITLLTVDTAAGRQGGADPATATMGGVHTAFLTGAVVFLGAVAGTLLIRRPTPEAA